MVLTVGAGAPNRSGRELELGYQSLSDQPATVPQFLPSQELFFFPAELIQFTLLALTSIEWQFELYWSQT